MGLEFLINVLPIGLIVLDLKDEMGQVGTVSLELRWEQDEGGHGDTEGCPGGVEGLQESYGSQGIWGLEIWVLGKLGS